MRKFNAENERLKRRYFTYLGEAQRYDKASVDAVAKSLSRFEEYSKFRDFKLFNINVAVAFKRHLAQQTNARTGETLSKSTLHHTLSALRNFFHWLAGQPGFRARLSYDDANYFNLSEKDVRVAQAQREPRSPTLEQVLAVVRTMPADTVLERRDRAIIAFTMITGVRVGALISLRMKHVDLDAGTVTQDAREVRTKNSKTFTTGFFPVSEELREIVTQWIKELRQDLCWGQDDPIFPATDSLRGNDGLFRPIGLKREHWATSEPVRGIFREAFAAVGLPYFNPHSLRKTLALIGERRCNTVEKMKAWSQNLGHDRVQTTLSSYGTLSTTRQIELIASMSREPGSDAGLETLAKQLVEAARAQAGRN